MLDLNSFCDGQRIFQLDTNIANSAVHLGMTEQKLDSTQARSRWFSASSRRTRIAQACSGFNGRFRPMMRSMSQAGRRARMAGRFGVCMTDPSIRHAPHNDNPTLAWCCIMECFACT